MNADRRAAYLRAMGLDVWVAKTQAASSPPGSGHGDAEMLVAGNDAGPFSGASSCFVEPGSGDTLLLCAGPVDPTTPVARDIARSLRNEPVWGWPAPAGSNDAVSLEQAIRDRLITRLILFGLELAGSPGEAEPVVIGTAELLKAAPLSELTRSGKARKALWESLAVRQWTAERARAVPLGQAGNFEG